MSDTYAVIGQAVFDYVSAIDISAAFPNDAPSTIWGTKLNRPPKADELNLYPAFAVSPRYDSQETGDTDTDFDAITYSVFFIVSNREATAAEVQLRKIVDIVRSEFRTLRDDPDPLHEAAYDIRFAGEWGGNPDQGERWYRLDVTVFVHETLLIATP
jgi:hypothetical protein